MKAAITSIVAVVAVIAIWSIVEVGPSSDVVEARMMADRPTYDGRSGEPPIEPYLGMPLSSVDQWRVSCTVDGGTPAALNDEVDGGVHNETGWASVFVSSGSAVCVHVGSMGAGSADPVDALTGVVIGTGTGCSDGTGVALDARLADLGCTSEGAATLVRVTPGRQ